MTKLSRNINAIILNLNACKTSDDKVIYLRSIGLDVEKKERCTKMKKYAQARIQSYRIAGLEKVVLEKKSRELTKK